MALKKLIMIFNKLQKNTEKIKSAIDETLIDFFTLQSSQGYRPIIGASGQMKGSDKFFIYMEINEEDFDPLKNHCDSQYFDITFNINRTGYQLQHRALRYVESHNLHSVLINNERYSVFDDDEVEYPLNAFVGELVENLNEEQKMAVHFITKSDNLLPYLLFGPAGNYN